MVSIKNLPNWGIDPVPSKFRSLGGLDYFILWSSLGVGLLVFSAGSLLSNSNIIDALIAIIIGSLGGSILLGLAGKIGSDNAIPSIVSMRPSFGLFGSYIPTFLNVVQLVGWTAFEIMVMSKAAQIMTANLLPYFAWTIIFGSIVAVLGLFGPLIVIRQWLSKFAIWIVYLSSIIIIANILLTKGANIMAFDINGSDSLSLFLMIDIVIAMPVSWMPLVADYNRFAKNSKRALRGTVLGFAITNILFYFAGFIMGTSDIVQIIAIIQSILLGFLLLILVVDESDNAFADIYSATVSAQNILRVDQHYLIIGFSIISTVLATAIPISEYESFLLIIGSIFVPLFGIVLSDYYIVKKRKYAYTMLYGNNIQKIGFSAIFAWAIGIIVYIFLSPIFPFYIHGLPFGSTIPSFAASSLIYIFIKKLWN